MSAAAVEKRKSEHLVEITVNNKKIEVEGPKATGLQIKEAAIAQGLAIELSFQLSEKLGPHKTKIIGDTDTVTVHEDAVFVAVADDDNS